MAQGYFELIRNAYLLFAVLVIGIALWLPRSSKIKLAAAMIAAGIMSIPYVIALKRGEERKKLVALEHVQVSRASARFAELCKGAGERIYKTVDNVDALTLLKVRPKLEWKDFNDPMLPGAAMAGERGGDSYIATFLGVESPVRFFEEKNLSTSQIEERKNYRGTISAVGDSPLPRYRHVDVVDSKDGQRYRYTSQSNVTEATSANGTVFKVNRPYLKRELADGPAPRYAVDYEDIVNPEDRKKWIAGTTIRVLDQMTSEVLGEYTTFLMDGGMGTTDGTRAPWSHASHSGLQCPRVKGSTDTHTRYFVDQILKLRKEGEDHGK